MAPIGLSRRWTLAQRGTNSRTTSFRNSTNQVAIGLAYSGLFVLALKTTFAPLFGYEGYIYTELPAGHIAALFALASLPWGLLPNRDTPSALFLWACAAIVLTPSVWIAGFASSGLSVDLFVPIAIAIAFSISTLLSGFRRTKDPLHIHVAGGRQIFLVLVGALSIVSLGLALSSGTRLTLPNFSEIYDTRASFKAASSQASGLSRYSFSWQASVINPAVIWLGLTRKRLALVLAGVVGQLIIFAAGGFKLALVSVPVLVLLHAARNRGVKPHLALMGGLGLLLMTTAALADHLPIEVLSLTRRGTAVPGLLTHAYLSFFSQNPPALLGHSILSGLIDPVYSRPPPLLVGELALGRPGMWANANFLADGYANFRLTGLLLASAIAGIVLRLMDRLALSVPADYQLGILSWPLLAWLSSGLLTSIFTHGIAFALVLGVLLSVPDPQGHEQVAERHHSRRTPPVIRRRAPYLLARESQRAQ